MLRMDSVFDGCKKSENERYIQPEREQAIIKARCKMCENERCIQQVDGYAVGVCGIRCAKMKGTYSKASV